MDGLSVAASIIQVIQISEQIVSTCYKYYRTATHAEDDIRSIINNVGGLKITLENLRVLVTANPGLAHFARLDGPLKSCQTTLEIIAKKLGATSTTGSTLTAPKVGLTKKLTWPWKEKELTKMLDVIEKQKTMFILALGGDTLETMLSIQDTVEYVRNTTTSIQESVDGVRNTSSSIHQTVTEVLTSTRSAARNERHDKILNWLKSSDPSTNHNAARKKHQPTTGEWFIDSPQFIAWIEGRISSIWLHGIPGAGKTILCSSIIDNVEAACVSSSSQTFAYFYFDFSDSSKRTVTGMLRSMIHQLSIHSLAPELDKLYQQCSEGTREPTRNALLEALISTSSITQRTFLIMDALDECLERDEVLEVITELLDVQSNQIRLLTTSRKELDIEKALRDKMESIIDLQEGDGVAHDICLYVQQCIHKDKNLKKWPPNLKEEMQTALVDGAHGMYILLTR